MTSQIGKRQGATARKPTPKHLMTGVESTELLESAKQALAMVKGERVVGGRVSVRQSPAEPRPRDKDEIVKLRERLNFSQEMPARAPNVSPATVRAWESGRRSPSDAALKLLAIAEKHPEDLLDPVYGDSSWRWSPTPRPGGPDRLV
jgi:putative transcriptional regulator